MSKLPCNCPYCCVKASKNFILNNHSQLRIEPYCKRYGCYLSKVFPSPCPKKKDPFEYIANTFCKASDELYHFLPVKKYLKDCMLYLEQEYRFFFYDGEAYPNTMAFIETRRYITEDLLDLGYLKKNLYPWVSDFEELKAVADTDDNFTI